MCQCLVLVWFWSGLLCQGPLSAAVQILCSQLGIAILAAVRRNSPDKGLSGEKAFLRITLAAQQLEYARASARNSPAVSLGSEVRTAFTS